MQNLMANLVDIKILTRFQTLIDVQLFKVNGMQMTHL